MKYFLLKYLRLYVSIKTHNECCAGYVIHTFDNRNNYNDQLIVKSNISTKERERLYKEFERKWILFCLTKYKSLNNIEQKKYIAKIINTVHKYD